MKTMSPASDSGRSRAYEARCVCGYSRQLYNREACGTAEGSTHPPVIRAHAANTSRTQVYSPTRSRVRQRATPAIEHIDRRLPDWLFDFYRKFKFSYDR